MAQLANALLSTQSLLAQDYFQLRVADEQRRILQTTVADYQATLHLVRTLVTSGVNSEADVGSAETQQRPTTQINSSLYHRLAFITLSGGASLSDEGECAAIA